MRHAIDERPLYFGIGLARFGTCVSRANPFAFCSGEEIRSSRIEIRGYFFPAFSAHSAIRNHLPTPSYRLIPSSNSLVSAPWLNCICVSAALLERLTCPQRSNLIDAAFLAQRP